MQPHFYIGFDPGGNKAFGWSILSHESCVFTEVATGTCSSAKQAFKEVVAACPAAPEAVGIDAPLFWSPEGDRNADKSVREMVCSRGGHSGTVSHVNSLRGACLVQVILVARMVIEQLKDCREFWDILVKGVVRVWKAGRVCLMNDMDLDIGAGVDDSYDDHDEAGA